MTLIHVRPQEIYATARELIIKAKRIEEYIQEVDTQLNALSDDVFSGESATSLRADYEKQRVYLISSFQTIRYFAYSLIDIAHDLETADRKQTFSLGILFLGISGLLTGFLSKIFPKWGINKPNWFSKLKGIENEKSQDEKSDREGVQSEDKSREVDSSSPPVTEKISKYNGAKPAQGTTGRPWAYTNPPLVNDAQNRNNNVYDAVINQFAVGTNSRYFKNQQGKNETYCNIFVWDVTKAMGAEIPHWVDSNGNATSVGVGSELSANGVINWLGKFGTDQGWRTISAEQAQEMANMGKPVVATQRNSPIGHVAMVRPGEYSASIGPTIAQAGSTNTNRTSVGETFKNKQVIYYYHE